MLKYSSFYVEGDGQRERKRGRVGMARREDRVDKNRIKDGKGRV